MQPKTNLKSYYKYLAIYLALPLFIVSCALETDPLEGKLLIEEIRADIDTNTIWNRATIYVIKKQDFKVNRTLLIQAGAIVKFDPDSGRSITVTAEGHLTAQGTLSKPIVFTSTLDKRNLSEDDLVKENIVKPGAWDMIKVESKLPCVFNLCNFYFGGGGTNKATIEAGDSTIISVTYCNFAYNDGGTIEMGSGVVNAAKASSKSFFRRNNFYKNNLPLCVNPNIPTDESNTFYDNGDSTTGNKYNVILVRTDYHVNTSVEWNEVDVAYVISGSELVLDPEALLLVGNDVTVKFPKNGQMTLTGANSTLRNYDGPGVLFTSIYDDSSKGDSNADGKATKPSKGDWKGISVLEPDLFEWVNVKYANQK